MKTRFSSTWPVVLVLASVVFGGISSALADVSSQPRSSLTKELQPASKSGAAEVAMAPPGYGNWTWAAVGSAVVSSAVLAVGAYATYVAAIAGTTAVAADTVGQGKRARLDGGVTKVTSAEAAQLAHLAFD